MAIALTFHFIKYANKTNCKRTSVYRHVIQSNVSKHAPVRMHRLCHSQVNPLIEGRRLFPPEEGAHLLEVSREPPGPWRAANRHSSRLSRAPDSGLTPEHIQDDS